MLFHNKQNTVVIGVLDRVPLTLGQYAFFSTEKEMKFSYTRSKKMAEQERDFKGVWIPKEVWLDTRLSALDKIIFVEIDSLDSEEKGCFASNKYIAEFCQCSETKVSKSISLLITAF